MKEGLAWLLKEAHDHKLKLMLVCAVQHICAVVGCCC